MIRSTKAVTDSSYFEDAQRNNTQDNNRCEWFVVMQAANVVSQCSSTALSATYTAGSAAATACGNALLAVVDNATPYDLTTKLASVTQARDGLAFVKQLQTNSASTSSGTIGALHADLVTYATCLWHYPCLILCLQSMHRQLCDRQSGCTGQK